MQPNFGLQYSLDGKMIVVLQFLRRLREQTLGLLSTQGYHLTSRIILLCEAITYAYSIIAQGYHLALYILLLHESMRFSLVGSIYVVMAKALCGSSCSKREFINWSSISNSIASTWTSTQFTSCYGLRHTEWTKNINREIL